MYEKKPCQECNKYEKCCKYSGWCDAQWDRAYNIRDGNDCWEARMESESMSDSSAIMEHVKYDQTLEGLDIVKILETYIQKEAKKHWKDDSCPPIFWVSLDNDNMYDQKIMITISHLNVKFTEVLFPRTEAQWGYDSVLNQMINMYNRTM